MNVDILAFCARNAFSDHLSTFIVDKFVKKCAEMRKIIKWRARDPGILRRDALKDCICEGFLQ